MSRNGNYGCRWREQVGLDLDVWVLEGTSVAKATSELECIEAEIVFLARQTFGQWPEYQTEIHFRPSHAFHREAAARVLRYQKDNARR